MLSRDTAFQAVRIRHGLEARVTFTLPFRVRTLAIDLGTRRVGLALSDEGGRFATPYDVLFVTTPQQATHAIVAVIEKEGAERLVVGLPLNMDDTLGPAAKNTIAWANDLAKRASKPLVYVDERLSSFEAEQSLITRKQKKRAARCPRRRQLPPGLPRRETFANRNPHRKVRPVPTKQSSTGFQPVPLLGRGMHGLKTRATYSSADYFTGQDGRP
jgi:putative Holliday junction resolvase